MAAVLRKWIKFLITLMPQGARTPVFTGRTGRMRALARIASAWRIIPTFNKVLPVKAARRGRMTAVYIGATTATLATLAVEVGAPTQKTAKKRLGDSESYPRLTQSLTLSHVSKKLEALKSSEKIHLILDDDFFHFVDVEAPSQIPARELEALFNWALKEKGFAPIDEWLWDIYQHPNESHPNYQLALLQRQQAEFYLDRLALNRSQVASLQPARVTTLANPKQDTLAASVPIQGPWLDFAQLRVLLARAQMPSSAFNLLANIAMRNRQTFQRAGAECTAVIGLAVAACSAWWPQNPPTYLIPPQLSLPTSINTHPLLDHEPLWQILREHDPAEIRLQQLEYQRGRWQISMRTRNLVTGQTWLETFSQRLGESWQVKPISIRSGGHNSGYKTVVEVEVSR